MSAIINYLTTIHFGSGAVADLPTILARNKISRPLLVTDNGLLSAGIPQQLPFAPAALFSDVDSNPDEASVLRGVEVFGEHGCDGIVAVGGGSPIDCAKCIGLMATHTHPLDQYALIKDGLPRISSQKPPLIAVPTTSGTGSEVGRAALITFNSGEKLGIISPHMIPTVAVCDPDLTLGLSPQLTAATGMDAISHCVETFCSPKYNPVADAIAIDGLTRAVRSIRSAVEDGTQIHHREEMMMSSLQGGLTFQKGLGMIHSLSHPLGALPHKRLHHGMLNAIFLPHVLRYNSAACPDKMNQLALAAGVDNERHIADFFQQLTADLGLPTRLAELGVVEADLKGVAEAALRDHSTASNPRQMSESDCDSLLRAAI